MEACVKCNDPLLVQIESDAEDEDASAKPSAEDGRTVPDSVELRCGCHFHWECLLDEYSMNQCPSCQANIASRSSSGEEQILCNLNNEGGLQESLDVMPLLIEASYLRTYPEERKARAFVEFAGEGDAISMLNLLREAEDDDVEMTDDQDGQVKMDILRYQDPLTGMSSALHAAVANNNITVAWLLLWLASALDTTFFPQAITMHAQELGLSRESAEGKVDIRTLKDRDDLTARQHAAAMGGIWTEWLDNRWLDP